MGRGNKWEEEGALPDGRRKSAELCPGETAKVTGIAISEKRDFKAPHTFGSDAPVTMECSIVKLDLQNISNKEQNLEIEAVETSHHASSWRTNPAAARENGAAISRCFRQQ